MRDVNIDDRRAAAVEGVLGEEVGGGAKGRPTEGTSVVGPGWRGGAQPANILFVLGERKGGKGNRYCLFLFCVRPCLVGLVCSCCAFWTSPQIF